MNVKRLLILLLIVFLVFILLMIGYNNQVKAQSQSTTTHPLQVDGIVGSAFTYQGFLEDDGLPADGLYYFKFALYDAESSGNQIGNTVQAANTRVNEGNFAVTLDFGSDAFNGQARWLEICVGQGNGPGCTILVPRQALTATPYALSLRPGAVISGAVPAGSSILNISSGGVGDGIRVDSAGDDGLQVGDAGHSGLTVDSAGFHGVYVLSTGEYGMKIDSAGVDGVVVHSAGDDGVQVDFATTDGVHVESADDDGVHIGYAGNIGVAVDKAIDDGFHVWSADDDGVVVDSAGNNGVHVWSADNDGVKVGLAGNPSWNSDSSTRNGFEVAGAEGNGLFVGRADLDGMYVGTAGDDGFFVCATGLQGGCAEQDTLWNGLEVGTAQHYGVYVDSALSGGVYVGTVGPPAASVESVIGGGGHGVVVDSAYGTGLEVRSAGTYGVNVEWAGDHGVRVGAVAAGKYAGWFGGDVYVAGSCINCQLATFGINVGDRVLEPGDIVSLRGPAQIEGEYNIPLLQVGPVGPGDVVIGVVKGRAEVDVADQRSGELDDRLVHIEGPAEPGEYVTIVTHGPMQVKASALEGPIIPGTRLTTSDAGPLRSLRTVELDGVPLAESAPILGIALEGLEAGEGLIWVLVSPH